MNIKDEIDKLNLGGEKAPGAQETRTYFKFEKHQPHPFHILHLTGTTRWKRVCAGLRLIFKGNIRVNWKGEPVDGNHS